MGAHRSGRRFFRASCVLSLFLIACGDAALGGGSGDAAVDADRLPALALVEELRLGSLDDPEVGFSNIARVDVDRDGLVYVLDSQDQQIRVYTPEGEPVRRIGRRGEGPGEFMRALRFGVRGDTVWVVELIGVNEHRITLFDRSGALLSTGRGRAVPVPRQPNPGSASVITVALVAGEMDAEGLFTSVMGGQLSAPPGAAATLFGVSGMPDVGPNDTIYEPRIRFDGTGAVVDTVRLVPRPPVEIPVRREIAIGGNRYNVPLPMSDEELAGDVGGGELRIERRVAASPSAGVFRVTRLSDRGDTLFARAFRYAPRPVGEETPMFDVSAWNAARFPVVAPGTPRPPMPDDSVALFRQLRGAVDFPPFLPPVRQIREAQDGRIWLYREDEPGDVRWLILEADGEPVGTVSVPRGVNVLWSSGDDVWAVERDEFQVPWLLRYRMVGVGGR